MSACTFQLPETAARCLTCRQRLHSNPEAVQKLILQKTYTIKYSCDLNAPPLILNSKEVLLISRVRTLARGRASIIAHLFV